MTLGGLLFRNPDGELLSSVSCRLLFWPVFRPILSQAALSATIFPCRRHCVESDTLMDHAKSPSQPAFLLPSPYQHLSWLHDGFSCIRLSRDCNGSTVH